MKSLKFTLFIILVIFAYIFNSCDDSGIQHSILPRGIIGLRHKNLKHIDPYQDGIFELWLRTDSLGNIKNYSLGRFNINSVGEITDTSGGQVAFKFNGDTNSLSYTSVTFVTMEPPGDYNNEPSQSILLSGQANFSLDSIYSTMKISGNIALGNTGTELYKGEVAGYVIQTPSSGNENCKKGLWFCDTMGAALFPPDIQIYSPGWVYEGWLIDKSDPENPVYYSTGKFNNPYGADFDGAGECAGPLTPFSKPGQDWIAPDCPEGKPQIVNIYNGNYATIITLEPSYENQGIASYYKPNFITVYFQMLISSTLGCRRKDNIFNNRNSFPEASVRITF